MTAKELAQIWSELDEGQKEVYNGPYRIAIENWKLEHEIWQQRPYSCSKPKKPLSGYFKFCNQMRNEHLSRTLTANELESMWKQLTEEQKQLYNGPVNQNHEQWQKETYVWEAKDEQPTLFENNMAQNMTKGDYFTTQQTENQEQSGNMDCTNYVIRQNAYLLSKILKEDNYNNFPFNLVNANKDLGEQKIIRDKSGEDSSQSIFPIKANGFLNAINTENPQNSELIETQILNAAQNEINKESNIYEENLEITTGKSPMQGDTGNTIIIEKAENPKENLFMNNETQTEFGANYNGSKQVGGPTPWGEINNSNQSINTLPFLFKQNDLQDLKNNHEEFNLESIYNE